MRDSLTSYLNTRQVSGYPSNTQAANVSKETTSKEIASIEGIEKEDFKKQNINLMFGPVNNCEYCTAMMNFPNLVDIPIMLKSAEKRTTDSVA